jgi:hypothetical protein
MESRRPLYLALVACDRSYGSFSRALQPISNSFAALESLDAEMGIVELEKLSENITISARV